MEVNYLETIYTSYIPYVYQILQVVQQFLCLLYLTYSSDMQHGAINLGWLIYISVL